jgi:hypothetical protein
MIISNILEYYLHEKIELEIIEGVLVRNFLINDDAINKEK